MKFLGNFTSLDALAQKLIDLTLGESFGYVQLGGKIYFVVNYSRGWATIVAEDFGRSGNDVVSEVDYPGDSPFNVTILGSEGLTSDHEIHDKGGSAVLTEGDIKWFLGDRAYLYRHLIPVLLPYFDSQYPEVMPKMISYVDDRSIGKPVIIRDVVQNNIDELTSQLNSKQVGTNILGPEALTDLQRISWLIHIIHEHSADRLSQLHFESQSVLVNYLKESAADYINYSAAVNITSEDDFPSSFNDDTKYLIDGVTMKAIYDKLKTANSEVDVLSANDAPDHFDGETKYRIDGATLNNLTSRIQTPSTFELEDIITGEIPVPKEPQLFSVQQMQDANTAITASLKADQNRIFVLKRQLLRAQQEAKPKLSTLDLAGLMTGQDAIPGETQTFDTAQITAAAYKIQHQSEELSLQISHLTEANSDLESKMSNLQTTLQAKVVELQGQLETERERQKSTINSLETAQREFSNLLRGLYPSEEVGTNELLAKLKQDLNDGVILTDTVKQHLATLSGGDVSGSDQDLLNAIDNRISSLVSEKKESDTKIAKLSDALQATSEDVRRLKAEMQDNNSGLASNTEDVVTKVDNVSGRRGANTAAYAVGAVIGFISKSLLDN